MPKRTNDFQRVVFLIQKILGGRAVVTESAILKDRETGSDVEIDILITGKVGATEINVGVECVDRSRPSDIEWMRSMLKKHEDLPVDKSIFVSKSGFTSQAIKKAHANGAETLTFDQVKTHDWVGELKENENLKIAAYQLSLMSGEVNFKELVPDEVIQSVGPTILVVNKSNPNGISISEYGTAVIRRNDVFEESTRLWLKVPREERKDAFVFNLNITPDEDTVVVIGGNMYTVDSFAFKVKGEVTGETPIKFELAQFNANVIGYSSFENIFPNSHDERRNAIFTLVERDGEANGLLSIPNYEGSGDREFPMIFPKRKNETNN